MKTSDVRRLVDYHCHLDLYPDYEKQFAICGSANIEFLTVTTTPRAWPRNKELSTQFPHIRVALGLHPQLVGEKADELRVFERYLPQARFVGEIGLDASPRFYTSFAEQKRIFQHILQLCAEAGDKILSIHSVRAAREVLNCIELSLADGHCKPVLHWFSGSKADAKRAVELGCYFSINEQMLLNPTAHRMLEVIPGNRLLTETDGPFLQMRNRPAQPGEVGVAVNLLAQALRRSSSQVEELLLCNLAALERHADED